MELKPVKVLAADDEPGVLALINSILKELDGIQLVGMAENAMQAIKLVTEQKPDLALLDVELPDMKGTELAEELKKINPELFIIFITGHREYSLDAYRVYARDYILKPIDKERLKNTIRLIKQAVETREKAREARLPTKISISVRNERVLINPDSIYYVEKFGRRTIIHCAMDEFTTSETLNELQQRLGPGFFRSHKSYLINIAQLERLIDVPGSSTYEVTFPDYVKGRAWVSRDRVRDLNRLLDA